MTVTATDSSGNAATDDSQSIDTSALPDSFPPLTVNSTQPDAMAPGYTLFTVFQWAAGEHAPADGSWLVLLDASGAVVWYQQLSERAEDARLLENGNILFNYSDVGAAEIDAQGNYARRIVATATGADLPDGAVGVDLDSLHHEVSVLPNGHYLFLSTERRTITTTQCPDYTPPTGDSLEVVGDVVVEADPDTGEVIASVSAFDDLNPCRRTDHDFNSNFWDARYGGVTTQDWTHGNAVFYDADEGLVFASYRHQDWIVAYHWQPGGGGNTGDLAFLVGDEGSPGDYGTNPGLTPTGDPFDWFYHQHAPERTPDGTLLMFDNGNLRPGTEFRRDRCDGRCGPALQPRGRVRVRHLVFRIRPPGPSSRSGSGGRPIRRRATRRSSATRTRCPTGTC